MEKIEIICEECGTTFMTEESEATLCPKCWEKIVFGGDDYEGEEGIGIGKDTN